MKISIHPDTQAAIAAVKKLHFLQLISAMRFIAWDMETSATELQSAWQDQSAGKFWTVCANDLSKAADRAEKLWESL